MFLRKIFTMSLKTADETLEILGVQRDFDFYVVWQSGRVQMPMNAIVMTLSPRFIMNCQPFPVALRYMRSVSPS